MADKVSSRSPGSIIFEIIAVVLVIGVIFAIITPQSQWKKQAAKTVVCQLSMENVYYASNFYYRSTGKYTDNLAEMLTYAERESILVHPAGFKLDRLTREDTGIDSFQIDYFDPYGLFNHFESVIEAKFIGAKHDSLVLITKPKAQYRFLSPTMYTFAADGPITATVDDRGSQGKFMLVGSQGKIRRQQILGETMRVPAAKYIYNSEPGADIAKCPSTHTSYQLYLNVKLAINAEMTGTLYDEVADTIATLSSSELFSTIVVYRWLKQADAFANAELVREKAFEMIEDSIITLRGDEFIAKRVATLNSAGNELLAGAISDSLVESTALTEDKDKEEWEVIREELYALMNGLRNDADFAKQRDDIVNDKKTAIAKTTFEENIAKVLSSKELIVSESGIINTITDSIDYYSNEDLIKNRLLKVKKDSVTISYLKRDDIQELFNRLGYVEGYKVGRIDSVGLSITCPIEGKFVSPERSILEKMFFVEGESNHGHVKNGDLSWDEKR